MSIEKIYVIYSPYIFADLYYASNTEWNFELEKARFFKTEELAQATLNRLQGIDKEEIKRQGLYVEALAVKAQEVEVRQGLHFSFD